jgi:hypothetical protein
VREDPKAQVDAEAEAEHELAVRVPDAYHDLDHASSAASAASADEHATAGDHRDCHAREHADSFYGDVDEQPDQVCLSVAGLPE